ncbi:MAG: hypothetical protein WAN20_16195 [Pseudonocardiaceae bacterium]
MTEDTGNEIPACQATSGSPGVVHRRDELGDSGLDPVGQRCAVSVGDRGYPRGVELCHPVQARVR